MQTGLQAAREVPQELVDAEFAKIAAKSEPMTVEGTSGKVIAIFAVLNRKLQAVSTAVN
jgi:hypothetical protein